MNEIVTAALRWHKANTARLIVSAEKRREQQHSKQHRGKAPGIGRAACIGKSLRKGATDRSYRCGRYRRTRTHYQPPKRAF